MSTTESTTRTIPIPEGVRDYVLCAFFADSQEVFERVKAEHPDGHLTRTTPVHNGTDSTTVTPVWHWQDGEMHLTCHGPSIIVRVVEEVVER